MLTARFHKDVDAADSGSAKNDYAAAQGADGGDSRIPHSGPKARGSGGNSLKATWR